MPVRGIKIVVLAAAADAVAQSGYRIVGKQKSGGRFRGEGFLVGICHRVGQSARLADDRDRAVFQTVKLVQPAGLVLAGH